MTESCLNGTIDLFCPDDGDSSEALYFISDLPGINLQRAALIADHETPKGADFLTRQIAFASRIVVNDFLSELRSAGILFRDVIEKDIVGCHGDQFVDRTGFKGVEILKSDCCDKYTIGFVEYVEIKTESAAAGVEMLISVDGRTESKTVNLIKGINRIRIDKNFREFIQINIDYTSIRVSDGSPAYYDRRTSCSCPVDCCSGCYVVNGIESAGDCFSDPSCLESGCLVQIGSGRTNTLNGFVVSTVCKSDPDAVVCQFRSELAAALLYRAGASIMEEVAISERANRYVRTSKEGAKELFDRWVGIIDPISGVRTPGEYTKNLNRVVAVAVRSIDVHGSRAFESTATRIVSSVKSAVGSRRMTPDHRRAVIVQSKNF